MIKSNVSHMQINIHPQNLPFYKDLLGFLGWSVLYEDPGTLGLGNGRDTSLWFSGQTKNVGNDYDGPGMNHLGFAVESQDDVDAAVSHIQQHGIQALFDTPRHRPEFSPSPDKTYYQVMFESPDRILFEVVYTGPKTK